MLEGLLYHDIVRIVVCPHSLDTTKLFEKMLALSSVCGGSQFSTPWQHLELSELNFYESGGSEIILNFTFDLLLMTKDQSSYLSEIYVFFSANSLFIVLGMFPLVCWT